MTDSISGFFAPEERAATAGWEQNLAGTPPASELSLRILHVVANRGAAPMSVLLAEVEGRPRAIVTAIDELEAAGLVTIDTAEREEIVRPTEAGLRAVAG